MSIIGLMIILSPFILNWKFNRKFKKFSSIALKCNLSGHEAAEQMLADNGIRDVQITRTSGYLHDHYNPFTKTIALSDGVYDGCSVAAVAVAAHECGHAVQHARGYAWLKLRSSLVPVVSFISRAMSFLIIGSSLFMLVSPIPLGLTVLLYFVIMLFSFITLPVEFNASRRGLAWIQTQGQISSQEHEIARNALWWAAMTYVVAALVSLFYFVLLLVKLYNLYNRVNRWLP